MLLDHFHPPLHGRRHWHGFHHTWACALAADLNSRLPAGWFAEPNVQFDIEIDVASFEESKLQAVGTAASPGTSAWAPPAPTFTIDFPLATDVVEVHVFNDASGPQLAAALELVSPANKDRTETREAFVSKCETYLRDALGLIVVDIVTSRSAQLHGLLMSRLHSGESQPGELYAAAYRPFQREGHEILDVWYEPLQVGSDLPLMPLFLKNGPCVEVDLPGAFLKACQDLRIDSQPNT